LKKYYQSIDAPPHIIWIFNKNILPSKASLIQVNSTTGDKCHHNIEGISNGVAKRIFMNNFDLLKDGKICNNHYPIKLTNNTVLLYLHLPATKQP
jgi:hypothetical protein